MTPSQKTSKNIKRRKKEIEVFTYNKYIKAIHTLHFQNRVQIAEPKLTTYNLTEGKDEIALSKEYEKIFKKILSNKYEMTDFINDFLYPKTKVDANTLKMCGSKREKENQAQLIYKIDSKQIYYIIEIQRLETDKSIISKLLKSCIDIIGQAMKNEKLKNKIMYPMVYPVILCFQDETYIQKNFLNNQKELYNIAGVDFTYNIIKIKDISKEKLLSKNTLFNKALLAQKTKNIELLRKIKKLI